MQLIKSPDPVLKQVAVDFDWQAFDAAELEIDMVKTMIDSGGIGLAANQVGLLQRVFAIRLKDQVPFCMFNPRVISASTEVDTSSEGCLSFPELWLDVKRPKTIDAEYFDRHGNKCTITLTGIDSRCFLHELDHLNGVCFTDIVSPLKLAFAKKKQQKRKRNG
jgi:peptide deformylase